MSMNFALRLAAASLAAAASFPAAAADVTLSPGVTDGNRYGFSWSGAVEHRASLEIEFDATGNDLALYFTRYDIDLVDEIALSLNGSPFGALAQTANNGTSGTTLPLPASALGSGTNFLRMEQKVPGLRWGVSDLRLDAGGGGGSSPDVELAFGVTDGNRYGWSFLGTSNHRDVLEVAFEGSSTDLVLSLSGFDIDLVDEIRVRLNGTVIDTLSTTADNASGPSRISIPASSQVGGTNTLRFEQRTSGWRWGVTDLLLESDGGGGGGTGGPMLSLDATDTNRYGWRFEGVNSHRDAFETRFTGTSSNLLLDVDGFDIDLSDEVRVRLNGQVVGALALTPNTALGPSSISLPASAQNAGVNVVRFEQRTSGYMWGVTNLRLREAGGGPGSSTASTILPIGDSITRGTTFFTYSAGTYPESDYRLSPGGPPGTLRGYREHLHDLLLDTACGADIEWTGTRAVAGVPDRHEGHGGWRTDDFLTRTWRDQTGTHAGLKNFDGWLDTLQPDIFLVNLGANDLGQAQSATSTVPEIEEVLDRIFASNGAAKVFLSNGMPISGWYGDHRYNNPYSTLNVQERSEFLAGQIALLVDTQGQSGRDVTLVDVRSGFVANESDVVSCPSESGGDASNMTMTVCVPQPGAVGMDIPDGLHPNIKGERHIAERFYSALRADGLCTGTNFRN